MRFEIYKAADGWRWRLRAGNGEIIASGEAYENKTDCRRVYDLMGRAFSDVEIGVEVVEVDA